MLIPISKVRGALVCGCLDRGGALHPLLFRKQRVPEINMCFHITLQTPGKLHNSSIVAFLTVKKLLEGSEQLLNIATKFLS